MRAAIVLAAGRSRRFGRQDKLRATVAGRALLDHVLARALASDAAAIVLVIRRDARPLPPLWSRSPRIVRVGSGGLADSLRAGLRALRPIEREVWVFLGDMPFAAAPARLRLGPGDLAVRPVHLGIPGHPMLVRTAAARAALPRGDRGLGTMNARTIGGTAGNVTDIDDRAALRRMRAASC